MYPNPSAGTATVAFVLGTESEARVLVYDVLGRRVTLLAEGRRAAGTHRFALDGSALPAGVYVVRAEGRDEALVRRITLVR